ncbi:type 1 glutamine amidotransferase [Roseibium sp. SCP14]|uniref:type 1 glutamine amidotransferase n=1 Tax=Roseibium sp. SCP14 TaxID=3141375 RepID=UPI00333BE6D0
MTFLVVENYPNTDLGIIATTAREEGHEWVTVKAHLGEQVPQSCEPFKGIIVLGGAQSAVADENFPHLPAVCSLIRAFHEADRPVMGICLGSQLIARAFGGSNILDRPIEFGWKDVTPTEAGMSDAVLKAIGSGGPQFHWHTDTVTLPEGAVHLAESDMTPVQAFRLGRATYAVQFHFEAGRNEVGDWSQLFADEIQTHTPDWHQRLEAEASRHASRADKIGAALARAWLALL